MKELVLGREHANRDKMTTGAIGHGYGRVKQRARHFQGTVSLHVRTVFRQFVECPSQLQHLIAPLPSDFIVPPSLARSAVFVGTDATLLSPG
jgi:hypothetical protein